MNVWVVFRQDQHRQTSETLRLEPIQAFTGGDAEAVKQAAESRAKELYQEQGGYSFIHYTPTDTDFWAVNVPVVTDVCEETP